MFKKINALFFENPTREFNVREVARLLKISPATASKELKELKKQGFLAGRKERMLKLYKANLGLAKYGDAKLFYTISKLRTSGLITELNKFYLKPTMVLFGSASVGLDTETSDIDILLLSEKTAEFKDIKKFEKKLKRKLQIIVVKDINELKNKHLINNILNGINLQGKIKWI